MISATFSYFGSIFPSLYALPQETLTVNITSTMSAQLLFQKKYTLIRSGPFSYINLSFQIMNVGGHHRDFPSPMLIDDSANVNAFT